MPRELSNENVQTGGLSRTFSFIIARRWYVLACHALLLLTGAYFAAEVRQDNSLDRIMTASDPDYIATRDFQKVLGAGEPDHLSFRRPESQNPFENLAVLLSRPAVFLLECLTEP